MAGPPLRNSAPVAAAALAAILLLVSCGGRAGTPAGSTASVGEVSISDAVAWGLASAGSSSVGFRASCPEGETLVSVTSGDGDAMLHGTESGGGMAGIDAAACGPDGMVLGPGRNHVMISGATHGFGRGDSVSVILRWSGAGTVTMKVPVVRYSDAVRLLGR